MKLFKNLNFGKLKEGLSKTRDKIFNSITETFTGQVVVDENTIDELEEILISSDIGFDTVEIIIESVRSRLLGESDRSVENLLNIVKDVLYDTLSDTNRKEYEPDLENNKPFVILIVGVNGVGKTTTIGKLAYNFKKSGLRVMVGAADTFRAAANEQLEIWAKRADVEIIQRKQGADPSAVAYDTVAKAVEHDVDVVLIDTAGRLHTKGNLMEELKKIKKVIQKKVPEGPHEIFLVLDGTTGQNAIVQTEEFKRFTDLTGLIITKLDGTAKGGVIFQITKKESIPVRYIGVGEGLEDLQTFDADLYINAMFEKKEK